MANLFLIRCRSKQQLIRSLSAPCAWIDLGLALQAWRITASVRLTKLRKMNVIWQLVKDRVDEYIELGLPRWTVNTCSMGHCLITLYQHTGDEKYLNIAKSKVEYLEKRSPALWRPCFTAHGLRQQ